VHGPNPRDYTQRTPKKMKAAALRGALSDRARGGRVHVVPGIVDGDAPSTKGAIESLVKAVGDNHHGAHGDALSRRVLVVLERSDEIGWKSLRNVDNVHLLVHDQLNTYDVLCSDDVVFTEGALSAFVSKLSAPANKTDKTEGQDAE
jgi:large subunit ribosomal protein L4